MAEASDARVARSMVAHAAPGRPPNQFDSVSAWIVEGDELAHLARLGLTRGTRVNCVSEPLQLIRRGRQDCARGNLEGDRLVARIALDVAQGVLALVGLEIDRAFASIGRLRLRSGPS